MAVVIVATIIPVPEHREEVIAALEEAGEKVHASDPGCLLYALHEGKDGRLVMIEKYVSDEAVAEHSKNDALAELRAALKGKLAAPMEVQLLAPRLVGLSDKGAL